MRFAVHIASHGNTPRARVAAALVGVALVGGCQENFPIPTFGTDSGTTTDTGTAPITKVNDDRAYLSVIQTDPYANNAQTFTTAKAVFLVNNFGYVNAAECFSQGPWCATSYPEANDEVVRLLETSDEVDEDVLFGLDTRDVVNASGDDELEYGILSLGEQRSTVEVDKVTHTNVVYSRFYNLTLPPNTGVMQLTTVNGDWGDRVIDTVEPPTPMVITSHDPMLRQDFLSTENIVITWEPGEVGEVFLEMLVPNGRFLQKLEDDGYHEVPPSSFALREDDEIEITLGRWSRDVIDVDGHDLDVNIQHNQKVVGTFTALGDRTELTRDMLYDDCTEAEGAPFLTSGLYYGDLAGLTNDYVNMEGRNGLPCLAIDANGPDAVLPVRLQPDEFLQVEYLQRNDDASMYLVSGLCESADPVCLDGVDERLRAVQESLAYRNSTGAPLDLWLVLDAVKPNITDLFELNIGLETTLENPLASSCADAMLQGPLDEGSYFGFMGTFPHLAECIVTDPYGNETPYLMPGGDGKAEIYLLPGETLNVEVFAPGAGPSAYLLYNCSISESCVQGPAGNGSTDTVNLSYTNATGVSEHLYLVVDSGRNGTVGAVQEYFLDIEIQ